MSGAAEWDKLWGSSTGMPEWDEMSEDQYQVILREVKDLQGKAILEAGSGSGRVSCRLATEGARVTLLDLSPNAIEVGKNMFARAGAVGEFVVGSIESMPFADGAFDIVWNGGVLEHFDYAGQVQQIAEMRRVCRDGGLIITINPYAGSLLYQAGKWVAEACGTWIYGEENPVTSLKGQFAECGVALQAEYTVSLRDSLHFLGTVPHGSIVAKYLSLCFETLPAAEQSLITGRFLVSVGRVDKSLPLAPRGVSQEAALPPVIWLAPLDWGTVECRSQRLARHLHRLGHRIVYVNASPLSVEVSGVANTAEARRNLAVQAVVEGTSVTEPNLFVVRPVVNVNVGFGKSPWDLRTDFLDAVCDLLRLTDPVVIVGSAGWGLALKGCRHQLTVLSDTAAGEVIADGVSDAHAIDQLLLTGLASAVIVRSDEAFRNWLNAKEDVYALPDPDASYGSAAGDSAIWRETAVQLQTLLMAYHALRTARPAEAEAKWHQLYQSSQAHRQAPLRAARSRAARLAPDQAIESARVFATATGEDLEETLLRIAVALFEQGEIEASLSLLTRMIAVGLDSSDTRYNAGLLLAGIGRYGEAVALLETAVSQAPDDEALQGLLSEARQRAAGEAVN